MKNHRLYYLEPFRDKVELLPGPIPTKTSPLLVCPSKTLQCSYHEPYFLSIWMHFAPIESTPI